MTSASLSRDCEATSRVLGSQRDQRDMISFSKQTEEVSRSVHCHPLAAVNKSLSSKNIGIQVQGNPGLNFRARDRLPACTTEKVIQ